MIEKTGVSALFILARVTCSVLSHEKKNLANERRLWLSKGIMILTNGTRLWPNNSIRQCIKVNVWFRVFNHFWHDGCHAFVAKLSDRWLSWFQVALFEPVRPDGLQHGLSIQISTILNLGKTFLRISCLRKIVVAWIAWRGVLHGYLLPFFQIPDFIYWTVLIFISIRFWMAWHWKPAIVFIILQILFGNARRFDNSGIFDNSSPKWEERWPHG